MNIQKFNGSPFLSNAYLVFDKNEAVLIDCGACMENIYHFLYKRNLTLKAIILTHSHLDHSYFAGEARKRTGASVYCHSDEARVLVDPEANATKLFRRELDTDLDLKFLNEGDKITVGDTELTVMHTPGHTCGSISLYSEADGVVFTGDTMFEGAFGRSDLKYGKRSSIMRSLARLCELDKSTVVYPGHGDETTIGAECVHYGF